MTHDGFCFSDLFQQWQDGVAKIPSAAITVEDAEMLHRMFNRSRYIQHHRIMLMGYSENYANELVYSTHYTGLHFTICHGVPSIAILQVKKVVL